VTVPTNTTIAGAAEIFFESEFTGNGTLVITVFDAEGGVNVALNGVELGALTGAAGQEVLYEVAVTNLVEGDDPLNVFKIWSTTADTAELRKLEVYRNFTKEQISDSSIWGNITGVGKPEDDATDNSDALDAKIILDGVTIEQSSGGAARILTEGMASGVAFDGDTFIFDPARDSIPLIVWGAGGKTESTALTPPTWKDFQAQNLTTGGFTAFLKISEIEGSLTSRTETGATTGGTFDFEMNKDETADEAFDDNYTLQVDVSVSAAPAEEGLSTVTVAYLANNGAGFVEKATKIFTNVNTGSAKTFLNNRQTINIDGMGLNDDWAVNVKSTSGNGGSITAFDNVTYESGSAGASTESATPTGVSGINFEVKSGEEGSVT